MRVSFPARTAPWLIATLGLGFLITAGCSNAAPPAGEVSGTVTLGGASVAEGVVTFEDSEHGRGGSAPLQDGRFSFAAPLPAGVYQIAVQPAPPPPPTSGLTAVPSPIPGRYHQAAASGLTATVQAGTNVFEFKLDK